MKTILMAVLAVMLSSSFAFADSPARGSSMSGATVEKKQTTTQMSVGRVAAKPSVMAVFGTPSTPSVGGMTLKAPDDGGNKYECTGNTCTCHGSYDCVKMIAADGVCDNDTVGCNDDVCVCNTP